VKETTRGKHYSLQRAEGIGAVMKLWCGVIKHAQHNVPISVVRRDDFWKDKGTKHLQIDLAIATTQHPPNSQLWTPEVKIEDPIANA
jgi:hypothetical protein